jgi:PIN domain nuclease of toxin-antitoxin system
MRLLLDTHVFLWYVSPDPHRFPLLFGRYLNHDQCAPTPL